MVKETSSVVRRLRPSSPVGRGKNDYSYSSTERVPKEYSFRYYDLGLRVQVLKLKNYTFVVFSPH